MVTNDSESVLCLLGYMESTGKRKIVIPNEEGNFFDNLAFKTCRITDEKIVGYLPRKIFCPLKYLIAKSAGGIAQFQLSQHLLVASQQQKL